MAAARAARNAVCILSKSDLPQQITPQQLDFPVILPISSVTGDGLEALTPAVERIFASDAPCDGTLLTNLRHETAIRIARDAISTFMSLLPILWIYSEPRGKTRIFTSNYCKAQKQQVLCTCCFLCRLKAVLQYLQHIVSREGVVTTSAKIARVCDGL